MEQTENGDILPSEADPERIRNLIVAFMGDKKPRTIESYGEDLGTFSSFLNSPDEVSALRKLFSLERGAANECLFSYKNHLIRCRLSPSTINRRLSSIRSIVRLARMFGIVSWEVEVRGMRSESYRDTRGPGKDNLALIFDVLSNSLNRMDVRDYAILRMMFDLGLRRGEICDLDVQDLDLRDHRLSIMGKGKRERQWMDLPLLTERSIVSWLDCLGDTLGPLFRNFDSGGKKFSGGRITGRGIHHILSMIGKRFGIVLRPHGIRHTAITEAVKVTVREGMSLDHAMDFSRHAKIDTILKYHDRERNVGGKIARSVSETISPLKLQENPILPMEDQAPTDR